MKRTPGPYLEQLLHRRSLSRWTARAGAAATQPISRLREMRRRAAELRGQIDRVIHAADDRLLAPASGASTIPRPLGADWAWRPALWQARMMPRGAADLPARHEICEGATLFHDCRQPELALTQLRNSRDLHRAPFGMRMEVFRFDGSFLSLVLDLPSEAVGGLSLRHVIRLDAVISAERPLEIFARLNIRHGPNVEQMVSGLPVGTTEGVALAEFDLAYTRMNEKRVERLWIDLIFEGAQMNQILLRDVTVSRRPRAEI